MDSSSPTILKPSSGVVRGDLIEGVPDGVDQRLDRSGLGFAQEGLVLVVAIPDQSRIIATESKIRWGGRHEEGKPKALSALSQIYEIGEERESEGSIHRFRLL